MSGYSKEQATELDREPLLSGGEGSGVDAELGTSHARQHATTPIRRGRRWRTLRKPVLFAVVALLLLGGMGLMTGSMGSVSEVAAPLPPEPVDTELNTELEPVDTEPPDTERARALRARTLKTLLVERYPHSSMPKARDETLENLERLATCLESSSCSEAEKKVVILASYHFGFAEIDGTGGEDVWARSTIKAFRDLGYTLIFAWNYMEVLLVHQHLSELVQVILFEESTYDYCRARNATNHEELDELERHPSPWQKDEFGCLQSETFPQGIPHWKAFLFNFWPNVKSPLGGQWTVSPEDYSNIEQDNHDLQYLGYSIEERCHRLPVYEEREHRALVLAKNVRYFGESDNKFYGALAEARDAVEPVFEDGQKVPFDLFITAGEEGDSLPEPGLETHGMLPQAEWTETLARSKALLGIGSPILSPSPYYGLCLGVPFINPILFWDESDPDDRTKWSAQHNALRFIDEPYVYNVRQGDREGLRRALQKAASTPIDRFIPPDKMFPAVVERARHLVETDWQAKAKAYVAEHYDNADEYTYLTLDSPAPSTT